VKEKLFFIIKMETARHSSERRAVMGNFFELWIIINRA
jgi:hypothetical protein